MVPIMATRVAWDAGRMRRQRLIELARRRVDQGLAPPAEIYRVELRRCIDWTEFPRWARPIDPDMFDRTCHEG